MSHAEPASGRSTFYAAGISSRSPGEVVRLSGEEIRHLKALRLAGGDPVRLTDGEGCLWAGRILETSGSAAECALEERLETPRLLPIELAFGIGNKAHVMWLIEKATEIGVAVLRPLESERTRSVADAARSPGFWNKARRRSMAAVKQSGGAWLPGIAKPAPLESYLQESEARSDDLGLRVRLDPVGPPLAGRADAWDGARTAALVVGPEGGWSETETHELETGGFVAAGLGPRVLRFETAAVVAAGVLSQRCLARRARDPASKS